MRNAILGLALVVGLFGVLSYYAPSLETSSDNLVRRMAQMTNPLEARTVRGRMLGPWRKAVELSLEHPMGLGIGINQRSGLAEGVLSDGDELFYTLAHNEYLRKLTEGGFLYLVLFIWIVAKLVGRSVRVLSEEHGLVIRGFLSGYIGMTVGFAVSGMVNEPFTFHILFWFLSGIIPAVRQIQCEKEEGAGGA